MGASLVYLEKPNKDIQHEDGKNDQLTFNAAEMQGWRINMEDAHLTNLDLGGSRSGKQLALFGVFDGHGGREVAHYTKIHLGETLKNNKFFDEENYKEALRHSFLEIDRQLEDEKGREEITNMKRQKPPNKSPLFKLLGEVTPNKDGEPTEPLMLDSIGCTANVILIVDMKKLYVANAGDSRCVMGKSGKAVPLSFDHKPENEEERIRIEKAGSTIIEGRVDGNLNLTRSLGDLKYKQNKNLKPEEHPVTANPDVFEYELTGEEDFIIMGCDGIWETKSNDDMVDYIYKKFDEGKDLKTISEDLLNDNISPDYTQTAGVGCDNMSLILIKFDNKDKENGSSHS